MEELQLNQDDILAFYRFLNHQKYSHFQVFMTDQNGRHDEVSSASSYPSKSYFIRDSKTLMKGCNHFKDKGIICLGINEREKNQTKIEEGISKINLILFDIDVSDDVRVNGLAPSRYIEEAASVGLKIQERLNELGFSVDYTAFSGNGFHGGIKVNIDLPRFSSKEEWKESEHYHRLVALETEMRQFESKTIKIDTISKDIARRVKIPGTYNIKRYKIANNKFKILAREDWRMTKITYLNPNPNESRNNEAFFSLALPEKKPSSWNVQKQQPREIQFYAKKDPKLKRLLKGDVTGYASRSEAEQALMTKLVFYGFTTRLQVDEIMNASAIGKWSEKSDEYKDLTLESAIVFNQAHVPTDKQLETLYEEIHKTPATYKRSGKVYEKKDFKQWKSEYLSDDDDDREFYIKLVNKCREKFNIITMKQSRVTMIGNGCYYTTDISPLDDFIAREAEDANVKNYVSVKKNVLELIKDTTRFNEDQFYYEDTLVPFLNGYYDIQRETFHEYDEALDKPFFYVIPHEYKDDKSYDCPQFKKKLKEWIVNPNSKVIVDDMFEAFGYTLTPTTSYKYFFVNYGVPNTGKSQLMNILNYIAGSQNTLSTSLNQLNGRFELGFLQWKIVAKSPDMTKEALFDNAVMKNLTGGDTGARGEIKRGELFDFIPTIKVWCNVNDLPEVIDLADIAFFGRVMLFLFEKEYFPSETTFKRDFYREIVDDEDEVQGIIHEALKGMKRLKERKCLRAELVENNRHRWLMLSNEPYQFIQEHCEFGPDYKIRRDTLWNRFVEEYGEHLGRHKFYQTLYQLGYPPRQIHDPDEKKPFWNVIGLQMKGSGVSYDSLEVASGVDIPEEFE